MRSARTYWRATRPIRAAKRIVDALIEEEHDSTTDDALLANQCNEVLKRLLVVALGITQLSKTSGDDWLTALDQLGECSDFSQGPDNPGRGAFAPDFVTDRRALLGSVKRLLAKIHHSKSRLRLESSS